MGVRATVLGASGYAGGELLRYLAGHPAVDVVAAAAASSVGEPVAAVHPHLVHDDGVFVPLDEALETDCDVLFSSLPSGSLPELDGDRVVIDLSDQHRGAPGWVYGLTELARGEVASADRIANPGCYPTAALLGLVPFLSEGLVTGPVVIDAMSGTSGAGRAKQDHLLHAGLDSATTAYGSTAHRHVPEIERVLSSTAGDDVTVSFTPHLVPMSRGLLVTARATLTGALDDEDAIAVLSRAYAVEPFVTVQEGWPSTKAVSGTNRCVLTAKVDARAGMLVVSSAIDNLGKGAAGQAIQNANLRFGLPETTGLETVGVWP